VWIVLLAAAACGLSTVMLVPTLTSIPRPRWQMPTLLAVARSVVVTALAPGMVSVAFRAPPEWALGLTLVGGAFALARFAHRYTPLRRIRRLTRALNDESQRTQAIAAMGPELDRGRPNDHDPGLAAWAQAALIAAAHLVDADEPDAARSVLERVNGIAFQGIQVANHTLLWAHIETLANRPTKARSALDSLPATLEMPLFAAHRDSLEALVLACEGDGLGAIARIEAWKYDDTWYGKLRLTARIVAHASRGESSLRERAEHELERRFGARAVSAARALGDAIAGARV
jgi:hypothetical protein